MTNGNTPTYEQMLEGRTGPTTSVYKFLEQLEPGVPTKLTPGRTGKANTSRRTYVVEAARSKNIHIITKTIDDVIWIVRLKPEDVKP